MTNKEYAMKKIKLVKEKQNSIKKEIEILKEVEYIDGKNLDEVILKVKRNMLKKNHYYHHLPNQILLKIQRNFL